MTRTLHVEVHPFVDAAEALAGRNVKALGVAPDNTVWWLADAGGEGDEVLHFADAWDTWERFTLPRGAPDFHYVQPLPDGEVLLVNGRCRYRTETGYERNAHVYSSEGTLLRELTLGDGIEDVQTTSDGQVWVSYFDEGVIGSLVRGGDASGRALGSEGLERFDALGQRQESGVSRALGLGQSILECYALNVASERETWFYSYTHFPLVRMRPGQPSTVWDSPVHGARAIAVNDTHVLFGGCYDDKALLQLYRLYSRGEQRLAPLTRVILTDETGRAWQPSWLKGRGPWLHGAEGTRHFRVPMEELLARAGAT
ncbi:hypothetical protein HI113_32500 [Corallococcus exiguus]|uniref:hypothetical protein n=1 Tax=Corallococcus TaxID=83461 RepID=UPI0011C46F2D|nr:MULTISPECIES: hypothetical protein [Corallococcus]NNB98626.1 hypothetical protein [Corallococcus exiguus]NPC52667.1 hypothetical protein [Corallococcus exiguus]